MNSDQHSVGGVEGGGGDDSGGGDGMLPDFPMDAADVQQAEAELQRQQQLQHQLSGVGAATGEQTADAMLSSSPQQHQGQEFAEDKQGVNLLTDDGDQANPGAVSDKSQLHDDQLSQQFQESDQQQVGDAATGAVDGLKENTADILPQLGDMVQKQEEPISVNPSNVEEILGGQDEPLFGIKQQAANDEEDEPQTQNQISPERRNCAGFEENIVLAVKECFFEDEIRCILIKKTKNGKKVKYFNRHCTNLAFNKKVCDICDKWFTNLSAGLPFTDIGGESIESFLDVKLDVENKYNVKVEEPPFIKQEIDMEIENAGGGDDEDWEEEPIKPKNYKTPNYKSEVEKSKRRIPPELKVSGGWVCKVPECGKVFPKRKGWLKHDLTHGAKQTCSYCGIAVSKLREHVKRKHPEAMGDDVSLWSSGLSFEPKKLPKAPKPPKKPPSAAKLAKEERHRKYSEDRDAQGHYVCRWADCQGRFEKKKLYLKHIYLTHEGGTDKRKRKKICDICGNLITANNMKQHVRTVHTHKNEKNFSCEHCGKEFKYRSELTVHLTHHTGEMNFTCTGCAKKFRRAAEARLCEKGHRGIFAFRCHMCDYKTNKKNHLDRHIESHLKATPFACPICGFKSGRKDNLKQHIEKRHCSATTTIKQLEDMYPDMYKMHETCEAAVIAKSEALAENFARMHDNEGNAPADEDKTEVSKPKATSASSASSSVHQREEKFNPALYQQNKYLHTDLTGAGSGMDHNLLHHAMQTNDISESMKYSIPEQVEQKYLPPDQQQALSEHERYFQEQRERMLNEQRDRVLLEQRERERTERERLLQEQREREHRERMLAEQRERERIMAEQRERERERMAMEMRERVLQEHRERLGQNSLAEMYQRMRSLDQ